MNIIAIANQKGGVGKTTTAVNLSSLLAEQGRRVVLVDMDPQANSTSGLGVTNDNEASVQDILSDASRIKDALKETEFSGLQIIAAKPELAAAEVDLVNELAREQRLKNALKSLEVDYVIIDCPPALGLLTINALTAADEVLIPVQAEYYAMEGLGQLIQTIQRIRQALNPDLNLLGVVMTMYDNRTSLSEQVLAEIEKHFPGKVFKTVIPRNVRLAEAPSHGKPIHHHDRRSKGAKAYKQLAKEVETRLNS
jgi:chromosome partitioning protein